MWEQWGLLGLLVGVAVAFGGGDLFAASLDPADALEAISTFFPALGGSSDPDVAQTVEQAEEVVASSLAAMELAPSLLSDIGGEAAQLAKESEAAEALAAGAAAVSSLGNEAVQVAEQNEEAIAGGVVALEEGVAIEVEKAAVLAAVSALASLAGLIADNVAEQDGGKGRGSERLGFTDISEFTPGTVRQGDFDEDRPMSALQLGVENFKREWKQMMRAARYSSPRRKIPSFVPDLVLSNEAVLARERARPEVPTPPPVRAAYDFLCWFIDVVFEDRPIQRFWFLETVARMPYFAYSSVLHLYETLGWWRSPELRQVHAAEEDNELHHLLIMESLGGDQRWLDRFFAQHGAVAYYWLLVGFFLIDPRWSYNFSRLIEAHAVDTYGEFVDANAERLKELPPPPIAVEYYLAGDRYLFDKFQTAPREELRRPPCATLYDVFSNIRDDEEQHVFTMEACEDWVAGGPAAVPLGFNRLSPSDYEHLVAGSSDAGRAAWQRWGEEVQAAARAAGRQREEQWQPPPRARASAR